MPVDVWAMGVITYLLLAGYAPFDRDIREQEIEAIIAGDYRFKPGVSLPYYISPSWNYWGNVSDAARNFVNCCLTVDPDLRITAAEALYVEKGGQPGPGGLVATRQDTVAFDAKRTFRKAVFRMLAAHLSPEQRKFNEDLFKYKQESEKKVLEHVGVIHHHNAEQDPAPAGLDALSPGSSPSVLKSRDGGKDVTDKLAAASHATTATCRWKCR